MLFSEIGNIRDAGFEVQRNNVKTYLDITNILAVFSQIRYIEVFEVTNPR